MYLLYADFNCTGTSGITCCIGHLVHDRSLISHAWTWISAHAHLFGEWLKQPHVLAVIFAWWITFTVIVTIVLALGFGPMGVGAGTAAALIQSVVYGAFVPAGGLFATMTSLAMTATLSGPAALFAAIVATVVAGVVWVAGAGR